MSGAVQLGVDVLLSDARHLIRGRKVGLLTHAAGVNHRLVPTARLLFEAADVRLAALFAPEHGLAGAAQAGVAVRTQLHPRYRIPVFSLYGEAKRPEPGMLEGLDVLVCDLQDAGCRYWTILCTLLETLAACGQAGVPLVVLDRPNPVGGLVLEGNVLDPDYRSFVGCGPIPIRTGLTLGEFLRLAQGSFGPEGEATVVPMKGWRRSMHWADTGLAWVPPSPNTPLPDTLLVYPGTCLVEGTNLSEGRGTTRPFEVVGAPWIDGDRLSDELNALELPGVRFRPAQFRPTFSKHQGELCRGVMVHVTDRRAFRAVPVGLHLLARARAQDPARFEWIGGEEGEGRPFIDLLAGGDRLRRDLDAGRPPGEILADWEAERAAFVPSWRDALLYQDALPNEEVEP